MPQDQGGFIFYLKFARPLVLSLTDPNDRALAAAWVQTLRKESIGTEKLRTDYLKLLLFVLQRKRLIGPFVENPKDIKKLEEFPGCYKIQDIAKEILQTEDCERLQRLKRGLGAAGDFPPISSECSADLLEYCATQDIPNFGVHAYYAIGKEAIPNWDNAHNAVYPKGITPLAEKSAVDVNVVHSQEEVSMSVSIQGGDRSRTPEAFRGRSRRSRSRSKSRTRSGVAFRSETSIRTSFREEGEGERMRSPRQRPPPVEPLGVPPREEEREAPTWGSNLITVTDPPIREDPLTTELERSWSRASLSPSRRSVCPGAASPTDEAGDVSDFMLPEGDASCFFLGDQPSFFDAQSEIDLMDISTPKRASVTPKPSPYRSPGRAMSPRTPFSPRTPPPMMDVTPRPSPYRSPGMSPVRSPGTPIGSPPVTLSVTPRPSPYRSPGASPLRTPGTPFGSPPVTLSVTPRPSPYRSFSSPERSPRTPPWSVSPGQAEFEAMERDMDFSPISPGRRVVSRDRASLDAVEAAASQQMRLLNESMGGMPGAGPSGITPSMGQGQEVIETASRQFDEPSPVTSAAVAEYDRLYPGSRAQGAPGLSFDFGDQDFNLDEDFEWKSPSEAFAEPFEAESFERPFIRLRSSISPEKKEDELNAIEDITLIEESYDWSPPKRQEEIREEIKETVESIAAQAETLPAAHGVPTTTPKRSPSPKRTGAIEDILRTSGSPYASRFQTGILDESAISLAGSPSSPDVCPSVFGGICSETSPRAVSPRGSSLATLGATPRPSPYRSPGASPLRTPGTPISTPPPRQLRRPTGPLPGAQSPVSYSPFRELSPIRPREGFQSPTSPLPQAPQLGFRPYEHRYSPPKSPRGQEILELQEEPDEILAESPTTCPGATAAVRSPFSAAAGQGILEEDIALASSPPQIHVSPQRQISPETLEFEAMERMVSPPIQDVLRRHTYDEDFLDTARPKMQKSVFVGGKYVRVKGKQRPKVSTISESPEQLYEEFPSPTRVPRPSVDYQLPPPVKMPGRRREDLTQPSQEALSEAERTFIENIEVPVDKAMLSRVLRLVQNVQLPEEAPPPPASIEDIAPPPIQTDYDVLEAVQPDELMDEDLISATSPIHQAAVSPPGTTTTTIVEEIDDYLLEDMLDDSLLDNVCPGAMQSPQRISLRSPRVSPGQLVPTRFSPSADIVDTSPPSYYISPTAQRYSPVMGVESTSPPFQQISPTAQRYSPCMGVEGTSPPFQQFSPSAQIQTVSSRTPRNLMALSPDLPFFQQQTPPPVLTPGMRHTLTIKDAPADPYANLLGYGEIERPKSPSYLPIFPDPGSPSPPKSAGLFRGEILMQKPPKKTKSQMRLRRGRTRGQSFIAPIGRTSVAPGLSPIQESALAGPSSVYRHKTQNIRYGDGTEQPSVSIKTVTKIQPTGASSGIRSPGSVSGIRPPGSVSGIRPPGSVSGIRPPGSVSGIRPPRSVSGIRPPGATTGTRPPSAPSGLKPPGPSSGMKPPGAPSGIKAPGASLSQTQSSTGIQRPSALKQPQPSGAKGRPASEQKSVKIDKKRTNIPIPPGSKQSKIALPKGVLPESKLPKPDTKPSFPDISEPAPSEVAPVSQESQEPQESPTAKISKHISELERKYGRIAPLPREIPEELMGQRGRVYYREQPSLLDMPIEEDVEPAMELPIVIPGWKSPDILPPQPRRPSPTMESVPLIPDVRDVIYEVAPPVELYSPYIHSPPTRDSSPKIHTEKKTVIRQSPGQPPETIMQTSKTTRVQPATSPQKMQQQIKKRSPQPGCSWWPDQYSPEPQRIPSQPIRRSPRSYSPEPQRLSPPLRNISPQPTNWPAQSAAEVEDVIMPYTDYSQGILEEEVDLPPMLPSPELSPMSRPAAFQEMMLEVSCAEDPRKVPRRDIRLQIGRRSGVLPRKFVQSPGLEPVKEVSPTREKYRPSPKRPIRRRMAPKRLNFSDPDFMSTAEELVADVPIPEYSRPQIQHQQIQLELPDELEKLDDLPTYALSFNQLDMMLPPDIVETYDSSSPDALEYAEQVAAEAAGSPEFAIDYGDVSPITSESPIREYPSPPQVCPGASPRRSPSPVRRSPSPQRQSPRTMQVDDLSPFSPSEFIRDVQRHQYTKHRYDTERKLMNKRVQIGGKRVRVKGRSRPRVETISEIRERIPTCQGPVVRETSSREVIEPAQQGEIMGYSSPPAPELPMMPELYDPREAWIQPDTLYDQMVPLVTDSPPSPRQRSPPPCRRSPSPRQRPPSPRQSPRQRPPSPIQASRSPVYRPTSPQMPISYEDYYPPSDGYMLPEAPPQEIFEAALDEGEYIPCGPGSPVSPDFRDRVSEHQIPERFRDPRRRAYKHNIRIGSTAANRYRMKRHSAAPSLPTLGERSYQEQYEEAQGGYGIGWDTFRDRSSSSTSVPESDSVIIQTIEENIPSTSEAARGSPRRRKETTTVVRQSPVQENQRREEPQMAAPCQRRTRRDPLLDICPGLEEYRRKIGAPLEEVIEETEEEEDDLSDFKWCG